MKSASVNSRVISTLLLILLIFTGFPIEAQTDDNLPTIDGIDEIDEWSEGDETKILMNSGVEVSYTHLYSATDMYFLVKVPHNGPEDVINTNVSTGQHDYFGIEFDNNGDSVIMGTSQSPDDMVLVDYIDQGAVDLYSYGYKVYEDTLNNGLENTEGKSSGEDGIITYEIRKPLKSQDSNGYDVSLKTGDTYQIMIAFWDNKFPHSAAVFTNMEVGGEYFIEFTVGDPIHPVAKEIISLLFFGIAVAIFFGLETFRRKSLT